MTRHRYRAARTLAAFALGSLVVLALPSSGNASGGDDDEVRREGPCSATAGWEMRARLDDGHRIEVRGEVDGGRGGQTWTWKIKHNGSVSASGRAVTSGGGAFEVRRALVDLRGVDHCVFRAVRLRTGEVCRGTIDW